jgi:uncharacterized membrane protein
VGLLVLLLGLATFVGTHLFATRRTTRADAIARLGEGPYKLAFSVASIVGVLLIAWGFSHYRAAGWVQLWDPPSWTRHITIALMLPAVILIIAAYVPGRIKSTLKHPMLAGVKLWAFAHLLSNGDLGSVILFGSLLAWAVYDRISLKHRVQTDVAVVPGGGWRNDLISVIAGILVYLALGFTFHPLVIGVPAFR